MRRNEQARWLQTSADCVEAWRQVLEVLLTAVPAALLTEQPDQVIMDVSRHILNKVTAVHRYGIVDFMGSLSSRNHESLLRFTSLSRACTLRI